MPSTTCWRAGPNPKKNHAHHPKSLTHSLCTAARTYVKVSFGKYLLVLDLVRGIDDDAVKAVAREDGTLVLTLPKCPDDGQGEGGLWPSLTLPPQEQQDKKVLHARRTQAMEDRRAKEHQTLRATKEKKQELERQALQARLDLEAAQRKRLEDQQAQAKDSFFRETDSEPPSTSCSPPEPVRHAAKPAGVPPVRNAITGAPTTVHVTFTPRLFPTPLRESKKEEEEDWIARHQPQWAKSHQLQVPATKDHHGEDDARDIGERDPVWLKAQGDKICRAGDHQAAIHAYTAALQRDATGGAVERHVVLGNRALCHFKTGRFDNCVEDCGQALLATVEDDERHDPVRVRLHVRRGAAFCQLGNHAKALEDYKYVQWTVCVCLLGVACGGGLSTGFSEPFPQTTHPPLFPPCRTALYFAPDDPSLRKDVAALEARVLEQETE